MRVSELAKELGTSSDVILGRLKALRLKAKDSKQELNEAVEAVIRREFKGAVKAAAKTVATKTEAKTTLAAVKEKKTLAKPKASVTEKTTAKKVTAKKEEKKPKTAATKIKPFKPEAAKKTATALTTKTVSQPAAPMALKEEAVIKKPVVKSPAQTVSPATIKKPEAAVKKPAAGQPAVQPAARTPPLAKKEDQIAKAKEIPQPAATPVIEKPKGQLIPLELPIPITVKDLSVRLQQKPSVVLKMLLQDGVFAHINQNLNEEVVRKIAEDFGFLLTKSKTQEEELIEFHKMKPEDPVFLKTRPPVVTFMGHVDHGKTSLVDRIRKTKVADEEHGGITQHIGAYSVHLPKGRITFQDTPGHEAFTAMRARGAQITDLVVLVIAADEGVMPQTEEAINHARAAEVPIIVALNKIDKRNADVDRVKKQLMEKDLTPEEWGGKTVVVGVSAVTGEGIDTLLEMILLEAELLELKANPDKQASGVVIEAQLSQGQGAVATVIVQNGTLREGDIVIVGPHYGRVKAMFDEHEHAVKEAGPATPVAIVGLPAVPAAGEIFYVVENEKQAKEIAAAREEQFKNQRLQSAASRITLEDLYSQIQEGKVKGLNIILKADVQGSLEALKASLEKIPNDQIQLKFIHTGVGDISTSDVILAAASNAIIIGFQVEINARAKEELEKQAVDVRTYRIIYDAVNDIKNALEGLLEPTMKKKVVGRVEIRQIFKLSKGIIAGCYVQKGRVHRKVLVDVLRNGTVVFSGKLSSLKRFKDDVREVAEGFECGLTVDGFDDIQIGDVMEAYELETIVRKLMPA